MPVIAGEVLLVPAAEAAIQIARPGGEAADGAEPEIGDGVAAEIAAEVDHAAIAAALPSIDLQAGELGPDGPDVIAARQALLGGVAESILDAIDRQRSAGAEIGNHRSERDAGADGVGLGNEQGMNAV